MTSSPALLVGGWKIFTYLYLRTLAALHGAAVSWIGWVAWQSRGDRSVRWFRWAAWSALAAVLLGGAFALLSRSSGG